MHMEYLCLYLRPKKQVSINFLKIESQKFRSLMTLELKNQNNKISKKCPNTAKLNNTLLINTWNTEKVKKCIRQYFELNESKTSFQNL